MKVELLTDESDGLGEGTGPDAESALYDARLAELGPVTKAYRFLDRYTTTRPRRWLGKMHKQSSGRLKRYPDEFFYEQMGLICLPKLPQSLPWAVSARRQPCLLR